MQWQTWMQWLVPVLSALLTGSGLWALLAARQTARATVAAAQATAAPATITAATADWSSLMTFWQNEIAVLRSEIGKLEVRVAILDRQREEDAQYIGELEQHILNELPPPPPMRRRFIVKVEEGQ